MSAIIAGLLEAPVRIDIPFAIAGIEPRYKYQQKQTKLYIIFLKQLSQIDN